MINYQKRKYQTAACTRTVEKFNEGCQSVLVVCPPGGGKTEMAMDTMEALGKPRTLWVVHTRALADQAAARLRARFGDGAVSLIMSGHHEVPGAWIFVAVVHSLLIHEKIARIGLIVLDEAHHYAATEWGLVRYWYTGKRPKTLGLTATPERDDGKPLGDIFDAMIVAAQYSELIAGGYIVPALVISPPRYLRSHWAMHPVDAYSRYGGLKKAIGFYPDVDTAKLYTRAFIERAVAAAVYYGDQPEKEKAIAFEGYANGPCPILNAVDALTEGVDVNCDVLLIGRSFHFVGAYLQATGRGLRPAPGKRFVIQIDLTGSSVRHGKPHMDRTYSLEGRAISEGPGGGGGGEPANPEVLGIDMSPMADEAIGEFELPAPIQLPIPDPKRFEKDQEMRQILKRMRTRHGADAAKQLEAAMKSLET